jgi:hypothetical protein
MNPLDANAKPTNQRLSGGKAVSSTDVEIAVRMGIKMLTQGNGLKTIQDALNQSKDPAQVIGQFLAQMMAQMAEQLRAKIGLDPSVFLAKRGFLEQILDYIEQKMGYPKNFSDQVYDEVLNAVKAAAQNPPPPNNVMGGGNVDNAPPQDPDAAMPNASPATPQPGMPPDPQQPQASGGY